MLKYRAIDCKKFEWNEQKFMEFVRLSGKSLTANNGNLKDQRMIKEFREYIFTDKTNEEIASDYNISERQFYNDMKFWQEKFVDVRVHSLLLQDEKLSYDNIEGILEVYIPQFDRKIEMDLPDKFDNLDNIRLHVRELISKDLNLKFSELDTLEFEIKNLKWNVNIE